MMAAWLRETPQTAEVLRAVTRRAPTLAEASARNARAWARNTSGPDEIRAGLAVETNPAPGATNPRAS